MLPLSLPLWFIWGEVGILFLTSLLISWSDWSNFSMDNDESSMNPCLVWPMISNLLLKVSRLNASLRFLQFFGFKNLLTAAATFKFSCFKVWQLWALACWFFWFEFSCSNMETHCVFSCLACWFSTAGRFMARLFLLHYCISKFVAALLYFHFHGLVS